MYSNMIFRINLILKTCNYICYNYVASFLHVLNVIIIPANFAIKDLNMFFKSNWISKYTLYLSQAVWEANETICKEKPLLIKFELRSMKNFKTFGVLLSYISWEQFDNLKLAFCVYQVLWMPMKKIVRKCYICQLCNEKFKRLNSK